MKELTKKRNPPKTASAPKKPCAKRGRKPSTESESETPAGQGGVRLRDAVNDEVGKQSKRIAKALVNKTVAGNSTIARMLVGISGADKAPVEIKKARGPQPWVTNISNEPELPGPWDEQRKRDASLLPLSDYDLPDHLK
jgi:hypothetical protein